MSEKKKQASFGWIINILGIVTIVLLVFPMLIFYQVQSNTTIKTVSVATKKPLTVKDGIDIATGLIAADGYKLIKQNCVSCHSTKIITQNKATKQGWKETITWMQKTQGLWDLGTNEEPILNYLAKNYAPKNQGRRPPLGKIDWYDLKN